MHKNRITNSIIIGLATLVATATWAGIKGVLFTNGSWIWPSLGLLILLIFLSINWLLAKSRIILSITMGLVLISFLFAFNFHFEYLIVLLLALLFFVLGSFRAITEKESRIKIDSIKIFRKGLPLILTGLSLLIASAYYFSPLSEIGQEKVEIPRPIFESFIGPVVSTIELGLPNQFSGQITSNLEKAQDNFYQIVNSEINKRSQPYKDFFPIGLSIGIFFALKVVSIPLMWLTILLAGLAFKILIWSKAIHIHEKSVLKEVIEI